MIGLPVKMNNDSITVFKGDTSRLKNIIPIQERVEPNFYQQEVARIFKKAWLIVGSAEDLTEIGAYKVVDVPPLKASLVVVRSDDGKIRVFHNVCRHRGDKLVHDEQGCKKSFTCRFHAWTYSNSGTLTGVTDSTQFLGLDKEKKKKEKNTQETVNDRTNQSD